MITIQELLEWLKVEARIRKKSMKASIWYPEDYEYVHGESSAYEDVIKYIEKRLKE